MSSPELVVRAEWVRGTSWPEESLADESLDEDDAVGVATWHTARALAAHDQLRRDALAAWTDAEIDKAPEALLDALKIKEKALESALIRHVRPPAGLEVLRNRRTDVPGWAPNDPASHSSGIGGVDISFYEGESLRTAIEVKLKDTDRALWEGYWDLLKLLSILSRPEVESAYLVTATTAEEWSRPNPVQRLFNYGALDIPTLLEEDPKSWSACSAGGYAHPLVLPPAATVRTVAQANFEQSGRPWQIRAMRISCDVPFEDWVHAAQLPSQTT